VRKNRQTDKQTGLKTVPATAVGMVNELSTNVVRWLYRSESNRK